MPEVHRRSAQTPQSVGKSGAGQRCSRKNSIIQEGLGPAAPRNTLWEIVLGSGAKVSNDALP